jgi:hypothetical protein
VALLKQVKGVGTLIALTYLLALEDAHRFRKSRDEGCYLGLQPGRRNSGQSEPQMHISKEGDPYLRTLLVQGAHHILGPFGADGDLRRWGLRLAERGGKNGKKRAVIATARKLAVLLHRLWVSGEVYAAGSRVVEINRKEKQKPKRRVPVTALIARPSFHLRDGTEVDKQMAAPAETRTPNLHRANQSAHRRVRMEGWRQWQLGGRKPCPTKNQRTLLTPTGLLMEGDYTSRPGPLHPSPNGCAVFDPRRRVNLSCCVRIHGCNP